MNDISAILAGLESTPPLLQSMLEMIEEERVVECRIPGKWTIHEHACHLATVDADVFLPRWRRFEKEASPRFTYFAGESVAPDHYRNMDLSAALRGFVKARAELLERAHTVDFTFWSREAQHPEYHRYTPRIMMRHLLLHDHFHMYRIEELWLTRDNYLRGKARHA
ncbi:DinB family protein [bacterium]|nr:DinB family protein [bacterium]